MKKKSFDSIFSLCSQHGMLDWENECGQQMTKISFFKMFKQESFRPKTILLSVWFCSTSFFKKEDLNAHLVK